MEFLVEFEVNVPDGAPASEIEACNRAEASAADLEAALGRAEAAHRKHDDPDEDWAAWYASYMVAEQAGTDLPS